MNSFDFCRRVDLFKGLNQDQVARIQEGCHEREYKREEKLFGEGENAERLWVVVEGLVELRFDLPGRDTSEENTISSISAAETFGWSSFVSPYKCRLSAYCASKSCNVLQLNKEFLTKLFEKDSRMGYVIMINLAKIISKRFHQLQELATGLPHATVKIIVHMSTCGIAAGAREVMNALIDEMSRTDRQGLLIKSSGCIGKCSTEPNVTVEIEGEEPVLYQKMTPERMRQVFKQHILRGKVQSDFVLV